MDFSLSVNGSCLVNEIYAVDPNSPRSYEELCLIKKFFGYSEGRFIAKYPMDWIGYLKKNFSDVQGHRRLEIIDLIEKCEKQSLPIMASYISDKSWLQNAIQTQHKFNFFSEVVSNDDGFKNVKLLTDILYGDGLVDSRGMHINSSIDSYKKIIYPLLLTSTELYIQDVNLHIINPRTLKRFKGRVSFYQMIFREILATGRCKKLTIYLDADVYDSEDKQNQLFSNLEELIHQSGLLDFNIEVDFIRKQDPLGHGRYIFSVAAGIQFDYGFDVDSGVTNHVHWLSHQELKPLLDKYRI